MLGLSRSRSFLHQLSLGTAMLTALFLCIPRVQAQAYPSTSSEENRFTLSGVVVNWITAAPIKRALVQINQQQQHALLTDDDGAFHIEHLSPGPYIVSAEKPGYFGEQQFMHDRPQPRTLTLSGN